MAVSALVVFMFVSGSQIFKKFTHLQYSSKCTLLPSTPDPHWFLTSLCSAMAVFLGTMLTMLVRISKATPTWPPSPNGRYRSCPSPAGPQLKAPEQTGEPAMMTEEGRERWTLPLSSTIIIITLLIHIIILTVFPLAINHQYPPMPTSTMPMCPQFSPWTTGGSRSVC